MSDASHHIVDKGMTVVPIEENATFGNDIA